MSKVVNIFDYKKSSTEKKLLLVMPGEVFENIEDGERVVVHQVRKLDFNMAELREKGYFGATDTIVTFLRKSRMISFMNEKLTMDADDFLKHYKFVGTTKKE